jgi:hypothetical protein
VLAAHQNVADQRQPHTGGSSFSLCLLARRVARQAWPASKQGTCQISTNTHKLLLLGLPPDDMNAWLAFQQQYSRLLKKINNKEVCSINHKLKMHCKKYKIYLFKNKAEYGKNLCSITKFKISKHVVNEEQ